MKRLLVILFATALLAVAPTPIWAQATFDWSSAMKLANTAYNQGDYPAAEKGYISAIQTDPSQASSYRNLARTLFWQDKYSEAVAYYDHYLRLASPDAKDGDQVKAERKLAASRAADNVWVLPDAQRMAKAAFDREIEAGRAYGQGGGGAWGLYQTLLRTGYAQPDLAQVRGLLNRSLIDEFDAKLLPAATDLVPRLTLEEWQMQAERLSAARQVAQDPTIRELVDRRSTVVETAIALLTNQFAEAADLAKLARAKNPDLHFIGWYEVVALSESGNYDGALNVFQDFSRRLLEVRPDQLGYLKVLRGVVLQRAEKSRDAAEVFRGVLSEGPASTP